MPQVTIVIPTYNSRQYLPTTLNSILEQSYQDFEIIIVNDGSTDDTEEYIISLNEPRIRLIDQANQGPSAARNNGIANAQGKYIAFLDADDRWESSKLAKQVDCLENSPEVGLVYTWTAIADKNCNPTGRLMVSDAEGEVWQELLTTSNFICCGSTPMVRTSCFEQVGLFNLDLSPAEDWDMWLRIAAHYSFAVIKEPLVFYRSNHSSLSKSYLSMCKSASMVIENSFQSMPDSLLHLKNQAYNSLYFYLSWLAVKSGDVEKATDFQKQAIACIPKEKYSLKNFRLSLTLNLVRLLGLNQYSKLLRQIYFIRRAFSGMVKEA